jgi:4-amino-4-deoxy-L-arabinose transferase-like glycosyltransferase
VGRGLDFLGPHVEDMAKTVLLVSLAVAVVIFVLYDLIAVVHRYPLDYGEGPLLDQAMRLAAGQNIYRPDISSPPYTVSNYPPLYVLSLVPFVKLFGPSFLAGRLISIACTLASAFFLAQIIYIPSQDRMAAVTAGFLFFAFPYVVGWSFHQRVDMLVDSCSSQRSTPASPVGWPRHWLLSSGCGRTIERVR